MNSNKMALANNSKSRKVLINRKRVADDETESNIFVQLASGKRYAHTASRDYQLMMAVIQSDLRRFASCACSVINDDKKRQNDREETDRTDTAIVVVEHDLKEFILCILDNQRNKQCKLNLRIHAGEQVSFRVIGEYPVELVGTFVGQ